MLYLRTVAFLADEDGSKSPIWLEENHLYIVEDKLSSIGEQYFCTYCGQQLSALEVARSMTNYTSDTTSTNVDFICESCVI